MLTADQQRAAVSSASAPGAPGEPWALGAVGGRCPGKCPGPPEFPFCLGPTVSLHVQAHAAPCSRPLGRSLGGEPAEGKEGEWGVGGVLWNEL